MPADIKINNYTEVDSPDELAMGFPEDLQHDNLFQIVIELHESRAAIKVRCEEGRRPVGEFLIYPVSYGEKVNSQFGWASSSGDAVDLIDQIDGLLWLHYLADIVSHWFRGLPR